MSNHLYIVEHPDKEEANEHVPRWGATNVGMSFIAALCTFVEILKYMAETLTPWTMLFTHVIKMTCALAVLALDAVIYIQHSEEHYSLIGLGMDSAFL